MITLILCLTAVFASCDQQQQEQQPSDTIGEEPKQVDHAMHDYLAYVDDDVLVFTSATQLEGEYVDHDEDHNLIVMKEKDIDTYGNLIETYKVYDLVTGEVIFEKQNTAKYYAGNIPEGETKTTLTVELEYPVIRSMLTSQTDTVTTYQASFYEAKKGGEMIFETTDDTLRPEINYGENLYAVTLGDRVFWIDKNLDVLRQVKDIAAGEYDTGYFDAEYSGYLYSWTYQTLQVFNRSGACSVEYIADEDSWIDCHVLNDGNVLMQVFTVVDIYTACDFVWDGDRTVLTSYIVNATNGEMTEIELDYIVNALQNKYTETAIDADHIFKLTQGKQNKAVIVKFANGSIAKTPLYVVVDNQMKIEYTVENKTPNIDFSIDLYAMNANLYSTTVTVGGADVEQVFDLDGNYVCLKADQAVTDRYIVTYDAIYNHEMIKIFDAQENGFEILNTVDEKVFLKKNNFASGAVETYVFDVETQTPTLLADGINTLYLGAAENCYLLYDEEAETYTLYAVNGEALLVSTAYPRIVSTEDTLIVETYFNGKQNVCIIR